MQFFVSDFKLSSISDFSSQKCMNPLVFSWKKWKASFKLKKIISTEIQVQKKF